MGHAFLYIVQQLVGDKAYDVAEHTSYSHARESYCRLSDRWPTVTFQIISRDMNGVEQPVPLVGTCKPIPSHQQVGWFRHDGSVCAQLMS